MPPLDNFNRRFDMIMRNRTEFYVDTFLEKHHLAVLLPPMSANEPTHCDLAERCARIRTEIAACEAGRLSVQQAELSIRADASAIIATVKKIKSKTPWSHENFKFFQHLYEEFHDHIYEPFVHNHSRPWGEVDRLWEFQDCLADVEAALMSMYNALADGEEETTRPAPRREQTYGGMPNNMARTALQYEDRASALRPSTNAEQADSITMPPAATTEYPNSEAEKVKAAVKPAVQVLPQFSDATTKASPNTSKLHIIPEKATLQLDQKAATVASFSAVEDQINHRQKGEATTLDPVNYTTEDTDSASSPVAGPPQLGSVIRRGGRSTPRIFNGSFSQLEGGIHKLRSSRASNPSDSALQQIEIKDFATPPQGTPHTSSPSSPALQIRPRELPLRIDSTNVRPRNFSGLPTSGSTEPQTADPRSTKRSLAAVHRGGSKSAGSSATVSRESSRRPSSRNREHTL
ncbi:hypothetical protein AC578_6084 [Pseudocercospora eumusae]|uniref:Uncharacterized protein n=1 Tax=Pseudocercospora eumusae TaxID=321146 RepID=A0A139HVI3_9PEZI|nr:hypothetical protein AC578_6084 [Pseudocercospora eumusae]